MNSIGIMLAANAFPIVCVIAAMILILKGNKEGWGWLLLLAAFSAGSAPYLTKAVGN